MRDSRSAQAAAVIAAIVFPSLVTLVYFHLLAGHAPRLQQSAYGLGKILQFSFPMIWVAFGLRLSVWRAGLPPLERKLSSAASVGFGLVMAALVVAGMFAIYRWLFPYDLVESLRASVTARVRGFSVDNWQKFAALGLFYALVHSLLEEYYFRWFVFGRLRHLISFVPAMIISGLAFMSHHVIVLAHYFDGLSAETVLLSLAIAVGGAIWAWQYERSRSLLGPWLSHLLVDAGIFLIGYDLVRDALAAS